MTDRALQMTAAIYRGYGSSTGWLFVIPPELRPAVEAIVLAVLQYGQARRWFQGTDREWRS